MQIYIHPGDDLPIYRQIVRQITDAILGGTVVPGTRLPSHRELAEQLVIAPLTVKKAYDQLEREGLIDSRQGRGTFVSESLPAIDAATRRDRLEEPARRLLAQAEAIGVSYSDLLALLGEIHEEKPS